MVGPRSWIGGFFHRTSTKRSEKIVDYPLSSIEVKGKTQVGDMLNTFSHLWLMLSIYTRQCSFQTVKVKEFGTWKKKYTSQTLQCTPPLSKFITVVTGSVSLTCFMFMSGGKTSQASRTAASALRWNLPRPSSNFVFLAATMLSSWFLFCP